MVLRTLMLVGSGAIIGGIIYWAYREGKLPWLERLGVRRVRPIYGPRIITRPPVAVRNELISVD